MKASEAYVRRLLARQRLYGTKIGPVWAIYPADVEAFKRTRRPPGRPQKVGITASDSFSVSQIAGERGRAGTIRLLRNRPRRPRQK